MDLQAKFQHMEGVGGISQVLLYLENKPPSHILWLTPHGIPACHFPKAF
jgi:hypothetical protein